MEIKPIRSTSARGLAKARFGERDVSCTLDTCARRNMIDPDLVIRKCIERIDDDECMCGKPDPKAIGQYCTVFRINQEYLVTTVVDVVPGTSGVTLGSDWLNNNISRWNLTSGRVDAYDGSFHTKMGRDVRMVRTSGKKGSPRKMEPDQVLMGTPIYGARQRRIAAQAKQLQVSELPLEVTQLSKVDE